MRFIGELDTRSELRSGFHDDGLSMGGGMDAPDWVAAGGTWAYEDDCTGDVVFGARVPRGYPEWAPFVSRGRLPAMKTSTVTKKPSSGRGGVRKNSGRKPLDPLGTVILTVRLSGKQKATYDLLGGASWLRGQLDLFSGGDL